MLYTTTTYSVLEHSSRNPMLACCFIDSHAQFNSLQCRCHLSTVFLSWNLTQVVCGEGHFRCLQDRCFETPFQGIVEHLMSKEEQQYGMKHCHFGPQKSLNTQRFLHNCTMRCYALYLHSFPYSTHVHMSMY